MLSGSPATHYPIVPCMRLAVFLCLPAYAAAQYPYYGGGTPGRVVAGIVVGICFAILFLIACSLIFRRRRRGAPILPWQGVPIGAQNINQGPYAGYSSANRPTSWGVPGAAYPPPPGPPPLTEPLPPYPGKPPAYDGEENSGYGYPPPPTEHATPGAPQPGGFVDSQSPHSPPAAHVNNNPHSPWFRSSQ
ncbi:hypothetical protein BD414DRAFT_201388 [Trametes punicea]|nr:hypothetical protein BD414DRAFT_201388 [Trametes punicea]